MKSGVSGVAFVVVVSLLLASCQLASPQAEAPTWSVGDSWAWGATDIDLSQLFIEAFENVMELTWPDVVCTGTVEMDMYEIFEVADETDTHYEVSSKSWVGLTMDVSYSGTFLGEPASGSTVMDVKMTGSGIVYFLKDDLSVMRMGGAQDMNLTGEMTVTIGGIETPMEMAVDLTMTYTISYDPPLDLFDFPISVGESWTIDTTATIDGNITGTITMPMVGAQTTSEPISDSVTVSISASCTGTKSVTLPDGTTTSAYVISLSYDWGELVGGFPSLPFAMGQDIYYSPDRGYVVGQKISLADAMAAMQAVGEDATGPTGLGLVSIFEVLPMSEEQILAMVADYPPLPEYTPPPPEVPPPEEVPPPPEIYTCLLCGMTFDTQEELGIHVIEAHMEEIPEIIENFVPPQETWGDWLPPEEYVPPVDWHPVPDWIPPENWFPDEWWPEDIEGEIWKPPSDWMPPSDWVPPPVWIPPENWWPENFLPPEDWVPPPEWVPPPDNFLPNVVPPWMPIESWEMPENWEPREDWLPPEEWIPPEPPAYVCPIDGMEFDTAAELDAHHASAHPDVIFERPCPFCGQTFGAITSLETHFEVFHEDEIPTPDQIPEHLDLFVPLPLQEPPPEWEDFQLPPLEKLQLFIPPWLDPEENHWVPPENVPFWAWELDNILPGAEVSIYTPADMLPQMNLGGGTWVSVEVVVEVAHVGGIQLEIDPELDAPLDDVVVTVLNLEELPADMPPPDENFFEPIRIGTNIAEYIENAEVGFKVNRDWITANNLDENSIRLEHHVQGAWTELPTRITGRDENYIYCSAEGVPSFSVFAITADPVAPPPEEVPPEEVPLPEEVPPEEVPPVVLPLELIVVVVIVLLLVIAGGILKRRR